MKKLSKLLSVFVITGAVSASLGALAACGHTHEWEWKSENGQHWQECKGCEEKTEKENHVDTDNNLICDDCGETLTPASKPVQSVAITGADSVTVGGDPITLTAAITPSDATNRNVTWSSSDTSKATVSSTGVVTAVAAGQVTITVTTPDGNKTATKTITVNPAQQQTTPLESITITGDGEVTVGASITLTANKTPATATETITWSSSDTTKATVNETTGEVTGVAEGTVTITATSSNNKTATKEITVAAAQPQYEDVTTPFNMTSAQTTYGTGNKFSADTAINGKYTCGSGIKFEVKDTENCMNLNGNGVKMYVTVKGTENSLEFTATGASGSTVNLKFCKADGTQVTTGLSSTGSTTEWTTPAVNGKANEKKTYKASNLEVGTYYIETAGGSARIYSLQVTEKLEKSDATGISVSGGTRKFLQGRTFNSSGLSVTLDYANGRKDDITTATVSGPTADQMKVPGKYTVNVSYTPTGASTPFNASYDVVVYGIDSIALGDYKVTGSNRDTPYLPTVFKVGDNFTTQNGAGVDLLSVIATCSAPDVSGNEKFVLAPEEYELPDNAAIGINTAGKKTVTVNTVAKLGTHSAAYTIYYIDVTNADKSVVNVVKDSEITKGANNVFTVGTVNQALQVYKLIAEDNDTKTIQVAEGQYYEKVEIDIPNVRLLGVDGDATKVVLWFDALNGMTDPAGVATHSTDGSASVSIRASAVGFYAKNITFKNKYNTNALYEESKFIGSGTQAVACLVRADKAVFEDCKFTGYHDTLYADTGRHIFRNCDIEGRTDYVFGGTATALFENCTLRTLGASKTDKNGGYIVAHKGASEMQFGYVFKNCTLTDDGVPQDGSVSLVRGWEANMRVAFLECSISKAYSKEKYGEVSSTNNEDGKNDRNDRYTKMNVAPNPAQLFEYKNVGIAVDNDGSLGDVQPGLIENMCTILTDAQAAEYTVANIFKARGKDSKGNALYSADWDGSSGVTVTTQKIVLNDATDKIEGATGDYKNVHIDATKGKFAPTTGGVEGKRVQINAGTKLSFELDAAYKVSVYDQNNTIVAASSYKVSYETVETKIKCTIEFTAQTYVNALEIDKAVEMKKVTVYNGADNTTVFGEIYLEAGESVTTAQITALIGQNELDKIYTDAAHTIVYANGAINADTPLYVTVTAITDTKLKAGDSVTFGSAGNYTTFESAGKLAITENTVYSSNTNNSQFKNNGTITFTVAAGCKLTVNGYEGLTDYSIKVGAAEAVAVTETKKEVTVTEDTVIVLTGTGSGYLVSIVIEAATPAA